MNWAVHTIKLIQPIGPDSSVAPSRVNEIKSRGYHLVNSSVC